MIGNGGVGGRSSTTEDNAAFVMIIGSHGEVGVAGRGGDGWRLSVSKEVFEVSESDGDVVSGDGVRETLGSARDWEDLLSEAGSATWRTPVMV